MKGALLKVLIVLTSHAQLGDTGRPTGYCQGVKTPLDS
jgi:hypothetical protein